MKKIYKSGLTSQFVAFAKRQSVKRTGLVAGLVLMFGAAAFSQTNYYVRIDSFNTKTGAVVRPAVSSVKAWTTDPAGTKSGSTPSDFVTDGQIFNIQANGYTNAKAWTVSGVGSKVVIGNSPDSTISFTTTSPSALNATVDVVNKATLILELANTSTITWGTLAPGSTVRFAGNSNGSIQQVIPYNYQNLSLASGGAAYSPVSFPTTPVGVAGVFTPRLSNIYGSTINFNGTGGQTIPAGTYYNIQVSGVKTVSDSLKGTIYVAGSLTDNSTGAPLLPYTTALTNGVPTPANSTVNYIGLSATQNLNNLSLGSLTFSNGQPFNVTTMNYANSTVTLAQASPELAVGQKISLNTLNIKTNVLTLDTTTTITAITNDTVLTLSKPVMIRLYVSPVGHPQPGTNVDTVYATSYSTLDSTIVLDSSWSFNAGDTIKGQLINTNGVIKAVNGNTIKISIPIINAYNLSAIGIGQGNDQPSPKTVSNTISVLGTFTPGIGTINTDGSTFDYIGTKQNIAGGSNFTYNNLTINQVGASTATLAASALVKGVFTLQSGKLTTTTAKLLTLDVNASFPTVTNDTFFVNGPLAKNFASVAPFTFQIGSVKTFTYGGGVTITPATADAKTYTATYSVGKVANSTKFDSATIASVDTLTFYNIALSNYAAGVDTSAMLAFQYTPSGTIDSAIVLAHYLQNKFVAEASPVVIGSTVPVSFTTFGYDTTFGHFTFAIANPTTVPVKLGTIAATELANKTVKVSWQSYNELNVAQYVIEGSSDGVSFVAKGSVPAKGASEYSFVDLTPGAGTNYYRIKVMDIDGKVNYSSIVSVKQSGLIGSNISVYPNPVRNRQLNFVLDTDAATYTLRVTNILGQSILAKTITHNGGTASYSVSLPSVTAGIYVVKLSNGKDELTKTVIVE